PIYQYISSQHRLKGRFEVARLLYVAVTRAKKNLYLIGKLSKDANNEIKKPLSGSFLQHLWPTLEQECKTFSYDADTAATIYEQRYLNRLTLSWRNSQAIPCLPHSSIAGHYQFKWSPHCLDAVGKVVHETLEIISKFKYTVDAQ